MERPVISVIIPVLNEAATIRDSIALIPTGRLFLRGFDVEIIVVDNNSHDKTAFIAKQNNAAVVFEPQPGYGRALKTGFTHARGEIIVMGDGDGTYPLDDLEAFLGPILDGSADLITGSRVRGHILPGAMPLMHRYIGVPLLTLLVNVLFGLRLSDGHCGMRAFTHAALGPMRLTCDGMEFATEMLIRAKQAGLRIAEMPIEYRPRSPSSISKLRSIRDGWRHLSFMLREFASALSPQPAESGLTYIVTDPTTTNDRE